MDFHPSASVSWLHGTSPSDKVKNQHGISLNSPKPIFKNIFSEIERVLKRGGQIIIDFATDIKRTYPDGSLWIVENESNYTLKEALTFLKEAFKDYKVNIITDKVDPEKVKLDDKEYIFTSNFILINAIKKCPD